MASIFESYEQQFSTLSADVVSKMNKVSMVYGTEKKSLISNIERQLDEIQELLEQMDLEVRDVAVSERGKLMHRVNSYQKEYTNLETNLRKMKTSNNDLNNLRNDLFSRSDSNIEDQKKSLLDNTERLERSTRRLEAGYRIAVETEQVGQKVLDNLHRDRETISRTRQRLREGDENLGKSSRIVSSMLRRIIQNRLLTFIIIGVMIIVLIIVIFFAARKGS